MEVEKNRVDIFNFLRAYALLCVMGIHSMIVINSICPKMTTTWNWYIFTPAWVAMGMFYILSGYLLGKGFYSNKYKTDINGIISFYITRLIRILPMYLFFILTMFIFVVPDQIFVLKEKILIPLLTFTYSGDPGVVGIGATWFISTIFQLYLIAPLFYKFIITKINRKYHIIVFLLLLLYGLIYRICGCEHLHLDWYKQIYTPAWVNIDYFFTGMLINSFTQNSINTKIKDVCRPISLVCLFSFTILLMHQWYSGHINFQRVYAPTFTILIFILIFWSWDSTNRIKSSKLTFRNLMKNPLRILDCLGILSFSFYLYHTVFFSIIPKLFVETNIFTRGTSNTKLLIYTYVFTFIYLFIWSTILYFYIEKPSNKYKAKFKFNVFET